MYVFKFSRFYRLFISVIFLVSASVMIWTYYNSGGRLEKFIFVTLSVLLLMYTIHAWVSKVWLEGDMIYTRAFTGVRSLPLSKVNAITSIKLKGRYIFFLITPDKYVMVSTMLDNFEALRDIIKSKIPAESYEEIAKISDEMIANARNRLKLFLFLFVFLYLMLVVYFNYPR